jgi:hypothetical protein
MVAMSTPRGRRGWFYTQWTEDTNWERYEFKAWDNPSIDSVWLDEERRILGPRWFLQEYGAEFLECDDSMFSADVIDAAFVDDIEPLFAEVHHE